MSFVDGEQVGPYRVIEQLGRGGMATVFKAYHASLDRYVALKVLHPAFLEDPGFKARFEREAKVVGKLEHPHIIPIYDFALHNGSPYLVMKFVEGETLKGRITRKNLLPAEGVQIIQEIGGALAYAHKQGILHRDIKPSNVVLDTDGKAYLTDFGLARIASAGESTLSSDMMLGTPQYISPEQAMGLRDLDEGTDIYSLGVMIYELTVGQVPFIADTPFSIVHDHIYKPLPLPRAVNPKVPESVQRVLLKALAKERIDRFATVDELVDNFVRAVQGEAMPEEWSMVALAGDSTMNADAVTPPPTIASPAVSDTASTARRKKRRRWLWAIPVLFVLGFCALATLSALNNRDGQGLGGTTPTADTPTEESSLSAEEAAVARAEAQAEANPDSPTAALDLAMAYYDVGDTEQGAATYTHALELAGEDADFYVLAGDALSQREYWTFAFYAYTSAMDYGYDTTASGFREKIGKALYFASGDAALRELLFDDARENNAVFNASNLIAVRARNILIADGNPERAFEMLNTLVTRDLDTPLSNLVLGETLIILGEYDTAETVLLEIIALSSDEVSWIRLEARHLLDLIP